MFFNGKPFLYILNAENVPVPCENPIDWNIWMMENNRHVGDDTIDDVRVSTVFLAMDHNHTGNGPPILFETMVFVEGESASMRRYCTWSEAESGHRYALGAVSLYQQNASEQKDSLIETLKGG